MKTKIINSILEKRLLTYSLVAGAILTTPEISSSEVWRSGVLDKHVDLSPTFINFNGNQRFIIKTFNGLGEIAATTAGAFFLGTKTTSTTVPNAKKKSQYFPVNAVAGTWLQRIYNGNYGYGYIHPSFKGQGDKYIGVKFKIGSNVHYGWILINVPSGGGHFTLRGYAYEQTPNTTISCSGGVLPVELTVFKAELSDKYVSLNWNTATETNNYGFEIERNKYPDLENGETTTNWQKIGFISGNGNCNSPKDYSFIDNAPPLGMVMYRLKQLDTDGKFSYSDIKTVVNNTPGKFELSQNYPNPCNPKTKISYLLPETGKVTLKVYDMLGKEVSSLVDEIQNPGMYKVDFNGENLPSGTYVYKLTAGNFIETKKLLLLK